MQAPKNGIFYVLDRITGEFISGQAYTQVNWMHGFDESGRPMINKEAFYDKEPMTIFPTAGGAHNWAPMSFNPATGLVYIPTTYGSWTYAAGDKVIPAPYGDTGLAAAFLTERPNSMPFIGPGAFGQRARSAAGLGSRDPEAGLAHAGRRRHRWRRGHHGRQSGLPGDQRWPAAGLQRR